MPTRRELLKKVVDCGVIPDALIQRGFSGCERRIHTYVCERVFRDEAGQQNGLALSVWEAFNHGKPGVVLVQVDSAEYEATATVASSYDLDQLLPTIDSLIAAFLIAPWTEER